MKKTLFFASLFLLVVSITQPALAESCANAAGRSGTCTVGVCNPNNQDTLTPVTPCAGGLSCCAPKAGSGASSPTTFLFDNPLAFDSVEGFLNSALTYLQRIIVVLALVFLVIGGIMYIISAGNDKMMENAKGAITAAMIGLAIALAAPSFLKEIYSIIGASGGPAPGVLSLTDIALRTLKFLLSMVGILGIIMIVIGGVALLTSAGDEGRAETGKKIVTYAIIGVLVAVGALIIVNQIVRLLT